MERITNLPAALEMQQKQQLWSSSGTELVGKLIELRLLGWSRSLHGGELGAELGKRVTVPKPPKLSSFS